MRASLRRPTSNLQESVASGTFREDLYFRLAVVVVKVPPLRERGDDMALVAKEFLHRYGAAARQAELTFAPDALRALEPSSLARQRPRAAEPGAAGRDHGRRQTRHPGGPGTGGRPERGAPADAQRRAGESRTGDGDGVRSDGVTGQDHVRCRWSSASAGRRSTS